MLRRCELTVFSETDSSPAISGRDRFVGRYRSTLSSPGLSSSISGGADWSLAAGDAPCRTSRMSASSAEPEDCPLHWTSCALELLGSAEGAERSGQMGDGRTG